MSVENRDCYGGCAPVARDCRQVALASRAARKSGVAMPTGLVNSAIDDKSWNQLSSGGHVSSQSDHDGR